MARPTSMPLAEIDASASPESLSRVLGRGGSSSLIMRRISAYAASFSRLWVSGPRPLHPSRGRGKTYTHTPQHTELCPRGALVERVGNRTGKRHRVSLLAGDSVI